MSSIRIVVVLDHRDHVVNAYPIEIAERREVTEDEFIFAARRLARRDRLSLTPELLSFVIAPVPI